MLGKLYSKRYIYIVVSTVVSMGIYKHKQFFARMTYNTWMRIRMQFKKIDDHETVANYFLRLAKHLEANK